LISWIQDCQCLDPQALWQPAKAFSEKKETTESIPSFLSRAPVAGCTCDRYVCPGTPPVHDRGTLQHQTLRSGVQLPTGWCRILNHLMPGICPSTRFLAALPSLSQRGRLPGDNFHGLCSPVPCLIPFWDRAAEPPRRGIQAEPGYQKKWGGITKGLRRQMDV
jgi:hypothetical protein